MLYHAAAHNAPHQVTPCNIVENQILAFCTASACNLHVYTAQICSHHLPVWVCPNTLPPAHDVAPLRKPACALCPHIASLTAELYLPAADSHPNSSVPPTCQWYSTFDLPTDSASLCEPPGAPHPQEPHLGPWDIRSRLHIMMGISKPVTHISHRNWFLPICSAPSHAVPCTSCLPFVPNSNRDPSCLCRSPSICEDIWALRLRSVSRELSPALGNSSPASSLTFMCKMTAQFQNRELSIDQNGKESPMM